ncbi:ShlB/FhaC/HecB family hemolysin secretion/activation protein [Pseudomonas kitaguniensis]|uniref:ShlB/FhaC/HecB family hemolysin secretion/activation protein n=1 Tax=Pseudomonas kitaguniensis TaxID=2607908 RepID=UPI003D07DE21
MRKKLTLGGRPLKFLALSGAALCASAASAQVAPDSGQLQRQIEQDKQRPVSASPPASPVSPPHVEHSGPKVVIHNVEIVGAKLIPAAELAHQFDPYLNRPMSLSEIQVAAQRFVGYYRERGWFVRVQLPAQDVSGGTLRVNIVEGRFGRLQVAPGIGRVNRDFVSTLVGQDLNADEPYSVSQLERGLLLANDLPGVRAEGTLRPGQAPGTSDLELRITDTALVGGIAGANNFGNRFTGRQQGYGTVRLDNPSGFSDQVQLSGVLSEWLDYESVTYNFPIGYEGLRANLGYGQLHYRLGKEFAELDARGQSRTLYAGLSYPLLRSTEHNLTLGLNVSQARLEDEAFGVTLRRRDIKLTTLELRGDERDEWAGGGITSGRLALEGGNASLRVEADRLQDAQSAGVEGGFTALGLELRRDQVLAPALYLRGHFTSQIGFNNLASSQQFSLGGPYGVRGYPVNEGSGDSGAIMQLELHSLLPVLRVANLDGYAFFDAGLVRQHQALWQGWDIAGSGRNTYGLYATGVGLAWSHTHGLAINGIFAVPLGNNPGSNRSDRDQDGGATGPRVWLTASQSF